MRLWPWTRRKTDAPGRRALRTVVVRARPSTGSGRPEFIEGRFDAAQTSDDNRRHWAMADGLSADAALNPGVRYILRNRARYEVANNSYARGIVLTLANDVIGTGPRLQMLTGDPKANAAVEREFARWARAVNLAERLRTMRMARCQDGEAFAVLSSNPNLPSPVKLDVRVIEADQIQTTDVSLLTVPSVDGIRFDEYGNPVEYHVLKVHPGNWSYVTGTVGFAWEYVRIPAASVIHWFRPDRPGQHRGVPEITPALPLFAMLRRYTLAVLAAAETAADLAVVMKTNAPAGGESAEVEPMATMEFERNMAVFAPEGWEPSQMKAEQPSTTYEMFKHEVLNEIARCLNIPFNVAAGNSSGYNYASGRLDHQTYFKSLRVDQATCAAVVLDRILGAWIAEAILISDLLPLSVRTMPEHPHQWFWDGHEHVDPQKEASAQAQRLASHTTTLADEYARKGQDWETALRQRAKEIALMRELGLLTAQALPAPPGQGPSGPQAEPQPVVKDDEDLEEPSSDESEDI